ncbi:MAG: beta-lactamase family protein [Acidobacteria bacterium]|nr:beta-lactamase family protein [Acidobacteriota bacterium]
MSYPVLPYAKFLFLCCVLLSGQVATAAAASRLDEKVDAYVKQEMAKYHIPGMAIAVIRNGKALKLKGYGLASIELNVPVTERSVFQIYSTTKIFTGVALMKLVEEGKLTLETPVTDLIQGLPDEWKAIRIRNLLTHTSGLAELRENPRFQSLPDEKKKYFPREEGMRYVAEMPLKFKPGEKFLYHTSGYNILGLIVGKVAGTPFDSFLQERVFAPLGMASTIFGDTESIIKGRPSTVYLLDKGELRNLVLTFNVNGGNPGAGLNSSVTDLANFMIALDAGKVLKPESLREMWSPVKLNDGSEYGYGLGWTVGEHKGRQVVGHEGGGAAWIAHFPQEHLSIVVLCNLNGARADEIQYGLADLYLRS